MMTTTRDARLFGLIGIYIGRGFDQVEGRAVFIVADTVNIEGHS